MPADFRFCLSVLASNPDRSGQEVGLFLIPLPEVEFIVDARILPNYWLMMVVFRTVVCKLFETEETFCIVKF